MAAIYEKVFPKQYISKFLLNNIRQDSRPLTQYRPISIKTDPLSQCNASAEVTIGNTKVLCAITYELGLPSIFAQRQGQIQLRINPLAVSHKEIANMHSRDRAEETEEMRHKLLDLILIQKWLNLEHLYITDKCVWNIHVDIDILLHDGNVWDAIILAFQHAAKLTQIRYSINIPHLPLTKLKEREALYKIHLENESLLKSTKEDYRSTSAPLPPPNNNHIEIPKLELDLSQELSMARFGGMVRHVGVVSKGGENGQKDQNSTSINTLERPATYHSLLFPPIILNKMMYPTQIAVIPVQEVKTVPTKTNTGMDQDDLDSNQDHIPNTIKQLRPFISTRKVLVLDPTWSETAAAESLLTVIFDDRAQICLLHKTSGITIGPSVLSKCMEVAAQNAGRLAKLVGNYMSTFAEEVEQSQD